MRCWPKRQLCTHERQARDQKRQFIDVITAGRRRYRQIEIQSQDVIPAGKDTCLVSGHALIEMESKNGALLFPSLIPPCMCRLKQAIGN